MTSSWIPWSSEIERVPGDLVRAANATVAPISWPRPA
jgi:hypothetical protein